MPNSSLTFGGAIGRSWRVALLSLILAVVGIPVTILLTSGGAMAGGAPITGRVFQDFDSDGNLDAVVDVNNSALDNGVAGVQVRAFDTTGANVTVGGFATTDATGVYTLSTSDVGTGPYRLEFSNLPTGFQPSARSNDSVNGGGVGSSVQFAHAGDAGVNFAVSRPSQYCQNNPNVVVPCYLIGDQTLHTTQAAFIRFPYSGSGAPGNPAAVSLAVNADIGTTYGVAWQRETQNLYLGAYVKRGTGLGPVGGENPGTIYRVADPNTSPAVTVFSTVANAGTNPHPNTTTDWNHDPAAFDSVGKVGLADLELSEDGRTLFAINLNTRQLVRIDASNPSAAGAESTFAIPNPCGNGDLTSTTIVNGTGAGADWRPYGMGRSGNTLYVGGVCSGETQAAADIVTRQGSGSWPMAMTTNGNAIDNRPAYTYPGAMVDPDGAGPLAPVARDLRAVIYQFDIATGAFDPTPVANFGLGFERTCVDRAPSNNCRDGQAHAEWKPWVNVFPYSATATLTLIYYPQPMLADIEFDASGAMILGFRDRWGDQGGAEIFSPVNFADPTEYDHRVGGDILRACPTGPNQWTLENNAARCDGSGATAGARPNTPAENLSGPGNGEFYFDEQYLVTEHSETSLGSLALLPGSPQVLVTVMDSFNVFDNGVSWMNNTTGVEDKAYQVFRAADPNNVRPQLGKSNGLGDLELLCNAAPVEIGNRVWNDLDADGIQDPNEPGIANVTVRLYDATGTLVDTVLTDANGEWFFSSASGSNLGHAHYGVPFQIGASYSIRLDNPADYAGAGPLSGLNPTRADSDSETNNNAVQDVRDSDATPVTNPAGSVAGTWPVINYTVGGAGQNNHGLDFGFNNINYSLGNRVWFDANNNGQIELGTEVGIDGVVLSLYADTNNDGAPDNLATPVLTSTTVSGGYYRFDVLPAGLYVVCVNPSNFATGGALNAYFNANVTEGTAEGGQDLNDNGLDQASPAASCILSSTVRLGPAPGNTNNDSEPPNETDVVVGPNPQGNADVRADMTVDFGFYRLSLGNRLWFDADNDGVFDVGESPMGAGITVQLCNASGTVLASTTTDAGGNYLFNQVTVGPNAGSGLTASDYYVCIPPNQFQPGGPLAGYTNSTPTENDPDTNLDENGSVGDNGLPEASPAVNGVRSGVITLSPGATGAANNNTVVITNATTYNPTVDFGFYRLSLGNRLWFDTDNDGVFDPTEAPMGSGITVQLCNASGTVIASTTTDATGNYLFNQVTVGPNAGAGLPAGDYYVCIPPSQFQPGGPLAGYNNSTPTESDPDTNLDENGSVGDNGLPEASPAVNGVRSGVVTLTPGATGAAGNNTVTTPSATTHNPTVDFGFYRLSVGNTLWFDTDNDGVLDPGESPVGAGVVVNLYDSNGNLIATTTTDTNGNYLFNQVTTGPNAGAGLPPGNYYVQIPPSQFQPGGPLNGFYSSGPTEIDPNQNGDQGGGTNPGDNGMNDFDPATNGIRSNSFSLTPGSTGAGGNNTVNNSTGTTDNPTIDFGFQTTPTAIELGWFAIVNVEGLRVTLNWQTLSEIDNFGFIIYRSPTSNFSQATAVGFVNATNQPGGALYAFADDTPALAAWYYWLADVDTQGVETLHEPVSISPDILNSLLPNRLYLPGIQR